MPTTDELQQQIDALIQRVNAITAPPTDYYVHQYSGEEIDDAVGKVIASTGLVSSFNGRTGAVMPAAGDYTAAMVEAAPAGYGLGESVCRIAPEVDQQHNADSCITSGWWRAAVNTPSSGWWFLHVSSYNSDNIYQTAYAVQDASSVYQYVIARRYYRNGVWSPWEYINPPLFGNVEYRTIERWNGSPVYVQNVYCGNMADGAEIKHGIEGINHVIRYEGVRVGVAMPQIYNHSLTDVWTCYVECADRTRIRLAAGTSAANGNTNVTMWYTKTGE